MDNLYRHPKWPEAVDLWSAFFAESRDAITYSNWRHLNPERQAIENRVWRSIITPGARVLDIGCGKGFFLKRLHDNFGAEVEYHGVDISPAALQLARAYFSAASYQAAPGEQLPYPGEHFDALFIISTLEHVTSPARVLAEACRVLKPQGYLYIVLHKRSLDPLLLYTAYALARKLYDRVRRPWTPGAPSPYTFPISQVRAQSFASLKQLGCRAVTRGDLVAELNIGFYRKLQLPMSGLMGVVRCANRLPCSLFKNLEYWVWQK